MSSKVSLIKGNDRRKNVYEALKLIEDCAKSRLRGKVLIKPNLLSITRQLAATHVDAVRGVLDFVFEHGNVKEVIIAEGAGPGNTFEGYKNFGYLSLKDEYPIELIDLHEERDWITIKFLTTDLREVDVGISKTAVEADCRISVAVPKTHDTAIVTLSLKNMIGCMRREDRGKVHGFDSQAPRVLEASVKVIHRNLITLAKYLAPHISVIDGFMGMEGSGPGEGDPVFLGVAVASTDWVAADAVMAKIMGFEPLEIGYIFYANEEGLGVGDLSKIRLVGNAKIEEVRKKFKPHPHYPVQVKWREFLC